MTRSPFYGNPTAHAPLCDKHLVVLENGQNANADFNMMTNFRTDPNGDGSAATCAGMSPSPAASSARSSTISTSSAIPCRPGTASRAPSPASRSAIYARVDTVPNVNQPYDPNHWRLLPR